MAPTTLPPSRAGEDQQQQMLGPIIAGTILAMLAVIARFVSRRLKKRPFALHDYLIVIGMAGSLVQVAIVLQSIRLGLGRHIETVSAANVREFFIFEYAAKINHSATITVIKISVLFLYRALFQGKRFAIGVNIVMAFVVAWGIVTVLLTIVPCNPIHNFWDFFDPVNCIDAMNFFIWTTVFNVLTDIMILSLPIYQVWHLQMSLRQKLAVSGMFLLGGFVIVATILRLFFMRSMDYRDATWTYSTPIVWFTVELNGGVISACLPTLRPLIQAIHPRLLGGISSTRGSKPKQSSGHLTKRTDPGPNEKEKDIAIDIDNCSTSVSTLSPLKSPRAPIDIPDTGGESPEPLRPYVGSPSPTYGRHEDALNLC